MAKPILSDTKLTLRGLRQLIDDAFASGARDDDFVFAVTATGNASRPVISAAQTAAGFVISCAPPNTTSWSSAVDWSLPNAIIAAQLGISRQAVYGMRRRCGAKSMQPPTHSPAAA